MTKVVSIEVFALSCDHAIWAHLAQRLPLRHPITGLSSPRKQVWVRRPTNSLAVVRSMSWGDATRLFGGRD